jgi:predicted transcriptional regulator
MSETAKSIRLPAAVVRRVNRAAKRANRNPSDLATEALEWYFRVCNLPEETPSRSELRAIRRGREAFKKGDFILI